jgi:hypothetical protein
MTHMQFDRSCQHGFLEISANLHHAFGIHGMVHPRHILFDDGAFIEVGRHIVGGSANDLNPARKRLVIGARAFEAG